MGCIAGRFSLITVVQGISGSFGGLLQNGMRSPLRSVGRLLGIKWLSGVGSSPRDAKPDAPINGRAHAPRQSSVITFDNTSETNTVFESPSRATSDCLTDKLGPNAPIGIHGFLTKTRSWSPPAIPQFNA